MLHLPPQDGETAWAELQRVNLLREESLREVHGLIDELAKLEDEFIAGDLSVRSGPRKGQPLTEQGRRRRVDQLCRTACDLKAALSEDMRLTRRAEKLWEAT